MLHRESMSSLGRIFEEQVRRVLGNSASNFFEALQATTAKPVLEHRQHTFSGQGNRVQVGMIDSASARLDTIFTLDQRDFAVYRSARKRPFQIIPAV